MEISDLSFFCSSVSVGATSTADAGLANGNTNLQNAGLEFLSGGNNWD